MPRVAVACELARPLRRLELVQPDDAPLGLGDDLLGNDEDIGLFESPSPRGRVAEERGQVVTLLDLRDALQREDPELAGRGHPEPESGGPGSPVRRRPACAL